MIEALADRKNRDAEIPAIRTHVIANLIFGDFLRRAGTSAKRASPARVIGPEVHENSGVSRYLYTGELSIERKMYAQVCFK